MNRLIALTIVVAMVSILTLNAANGGQVFAENWDSGVINSADWTVRDGGAVNVSLVDPLGNGDYALKLNSSGASWGDEIYSVASYSREEYLTITFLTWCPPSDFPANYVSHGGFHKNNGVGGGGGADVYGTMEAALGYVYYDIRAAGGEDGSHGLSPVIGDNHMSINDGPAPPGGGVITQAVSKETAMMIRITLGPTSGAEWRWSMDNGTTWTIERDTRGHPFASSDSPVWVAFGPFGGGTYGSYVDDIVVEKLGAQHIGLEESGGNTAVDEEGPTSDTYEIVIVGGPSEDVVVTVDPDNQVEVNAAGQGNPIELTFTTANWADPQTVTVTAIDDDQLEDLHTSIIAHTSSSSDPVFNNMTRNLYVIITDNEWNSLPDDIRDLANHFNVTDDSLNYWTFIPEDNVAQVSTSTHPGLATVWIDDQGQDVKGITRRAIPIDHYPLPWEFQMGLVQNFNMIAGAYSQLGSEQANIAAGLNVAVTFSDPATWPTDRTQQPPNTHSFQLFTVHLGGIGDGLPQLVDNPHIYRTTATDTTGEAYLVYGRGDLGAGQPNPIHVGHWEIPYIWIGDGARYAGPAMWRIYYRCVVKDSRYLTVSIKFEDYHGWHTRWIDCSEYGPITGIWEIGPIFSADRWIPDMLCPAMDIPQTPVAVDPPDPFFEYYVEYCVFHPSRPIPFEQFSDDFNVLGYLGQWVSQDQSVIMETHSNPGYLTWTLLGPSMGTGIAPVGGDLFSLDLYPPPWEIEICFIPPEDTMPWNFYMNFAMRTNQDRNLSWYPSVTYLPGQNKHDQMNIDSFNVVFDPPVPESILSHKPLYMLIQWIDLSHVRLAFKAEANDPWYFSEIYDYSELLNPGEQIAGNFLQADWSTVTGSWGGYYGIPQYTKFLIDYIHYRYGLTDMTANECQQANLNRQDPVNLADFALMANDWQDTGEVLSGDTNWDELVDLQDLYLVSEYWLSNCQ